MPKLNRKVKKDLMIRAKQIGIYKKLRTVKETIYDENDKKREITKMVFSAVHGKEIPETEEIYIGIDYHYQRLLNIYSKHNWTGVDNYAKQCEKEMIDFVERHKLKDMNEEELRDFVLNKLMK